jgi:hypothetical protein
MKLEDSFYPLGDKQESCDQCGQFFQARVGFGSDINKGKLCSQDCVKGWCAKQSEGGSDGVFGSIPERDE